MTTSRKTRRSPVRPRLLVVLLGLVALLASSCASTGDDTSAASEDSGIFEDRGDVADRGDEADSAGGGIDAEDAFATAPTSPTTIATATTATAASAEAYADADASAERESGGGLFSSAPQEMRDAEEDLARPTGNTFVNPGVRRFIDTSVDPLSTFALDVDTGSYAIARRWLDESILPDPDSVRVEEYVNAFDYDYSAPDSGIGLSVEGGPSPFRGGDAIVRVGVQSELVDELERPDASLVFVIDTSGSMEQDNRLGLVKASLSLLVHELEDDDLISIVTYDSNAGVVLPPTPVSDITTILAAIGSLRTGGSTNLEAGLRTGYDLAESTFRRNGVNRVILASDGVANAGLTDPDGLSRQITADAQRGVQLVTLGFGMGNYNDDTMEQLADQGDGFYSYIDTYDEAEKVFRDDLTATLVTVARDAKIQVEFDDETVAAYRLIGFENRAVRDQDFRNDAVDAGEIGSGHQVTALYQLDLRGDVNDRDVLGEVTLRWLDPTTDEAIETTQRITGRDLESSWRATSRSFQLATTVGTWAEILRNSPYAVDLDLDAVAEEAERLAVELDDSDVDEFAELTNRAARLS